MSVSSVSLSLKSSRLNIVPSECVCPRHPTTVALLLFLFLPAAVYGSLAETRLFNDLLQGYNPLERPVANASLALQVRIKMFLQQILDVDEKNQLVSVNAWLSYVSPRFFSLLQSKVLDLEGL